MKQTLLEICVSSVASAVAAQRGGADRVELCVALREGGLTPSSAMIKAVKSSLSIPVHVLIRPREGDFLYTPEEIDVMCRDIEAACESGADGIVCGALDADGNIETAALGRFMKASGKMSFTFHRAFDLCRDPLEAVRILTDFGVKTLLTSGQAATAAEGVDLMKELVALAQPKGLTIMPGCGLNSGNIAAVVRGTGAQAAHLSAKMSVKSAMRFYKDGVAMGGETVSEYDYYQTNEEEVRACRRALEGVR